MKYCRMLSNACLAGLLGAAYVSILVLQLNPDIALTVGTLVPLFLVVAAFHGLVLAFSYYGVLLAWYFLFERPTSPGWVSVRVLAWLGAVTAGLAALVMWLNVRGFGVVLDAESARRMALGSLVTAASAIAFLTLAIMHDTFGRRGSRFSGAILTLVVGCSLALPLTLRGTMTPLRAVVAFSPDDGPSVEASPRVIVLALDGASLDFISPAVAEGRLPNFGKILDDGASMHLVTIRPTQPEPVWTAVATGKYPPKNGVRSAATYRWSATAPRIDLLPDLCFSYGLVYVGLLTEVANVSSAVKARPLWSVLSEHGVSVGITGWPMTYPARAVRGYVASDHVHDAVWQGDVAADHDLAFPPDALGIAKSVHDDSTHEATADLDVAGADPPTGAWSVGAPTPRDDLYRRLSDALDARFAPQFVALHYDGLDVVGHRFLRYAMPRSFGDVAEEERRRFGGVLERYYSFIDGEIGSAIDGLGPDDLLLVIAGFGIEPVSLAKRLLARVVGDPDLSGSHEGAPDGFLLAYGRSVAPGRLPLAAIVDLAPTVLYFLGIPVARDMDGFARTDVFTRSFAADHPITFIPTYDRHGVGE